MKRLIFLVLTLMMAGFLLASPGTALADEPAAAPAAAAPAAAAPPVATPAEMEQRLKDLEAYVTNGARGDDKTSKITSPGPGHNGFLMVCAALVLFMTLPGLALFYGGLVRQKNVLSIMAQCMGIAALVALLWWAVGYSLAFAPGSPFLGGMDFAMLKGVGTAPNTTYSGW